MKIKELRFLDKRIRSLLKNQTSMKYESLKELWEETEIEFKGEKRDKY